VQVIRDDTIETRMVQVGLDSDTNTEIVSGLKEGEMVVATAGNSLRDGDKVTPIITEAARMGR
jgi:multidrug efflux pump subunit AcrA (membrane-fusion protein)